MSVEPEYKYINGVGWVPTFEPQLLYVKDHEVRAGDIINGFMYTDGERRYWGGRVTSVIGGWIHLQDFANWHQIGALGITRRYAVEWFEVVRGQV